MQIMAPRVAAVIVTYHPDEVALATLLTALAPQVGALLVIDNTSGDDNAVQGTIAPSVQEMPHLRLHRMGENAGIAAAQNVGIRIALDEGFDYVLLSDQDSTPAPDMVKNLLACAQQLQREGIRVGCVSPAYFDETTGQPFSFQVQRPRRLFYDSVPATEAEPWIEVVTTISSGSLIPRGALEAVGGMREDFFIDDVDTEWCHRARALGFRNYGTSTARLSHRLGDASFPVWYFGWRRHSAYSTVRLYYRFRNFVLMCRLPHVPLRWSIRAAWFWLGNFYAYAFFAGRRAENVKSMLHGLCDGIRGRTGPYPS